MPLTNKMHFISEWHTLETFNSYTKKSGKAVYCHSRYDLDDVAVFYLLITIIYPLQNYDAFINVDIK